MSLGRFGTVLVLALFTAGAASVPSDRTLRPAAEAIEEGAGAAAGPGAGARLGIPRLAGGQMVWGPAAEPLASDLAPFRNALDPAAAADSDREAAWRSLARAPRWRLYALRRLAALALARADSAGADSCLELLGVARGIWQWPALADGAALALARGDTAGALRRIRDADPADWPDDDRSQWTGLLATLEAATGDTAGALERARQAIRRYPALPATARLLPRWEGWLAARGLRPDAADQRAAAEVDFFRPDRASAARRLRAARDSLRGAERVAVGLRLGEVLRLSRRYSEAARALKLAADDATEPAERARAALERARVERDAGHADRAEVWYGRAAELAPGPGLRETAFWERGRELEQLGAWKQARADYARVAALGLGRTDDAALRAGLLWYVDGQPDSARAAWLRSGSEAGEFWIAVSLRRAGLAAADSALEAIAVRPGYTFYRAAARDSLRCPGRPEDLGPAPAPEFDDETLALARDLASLGEVQDAGTLLQRWYARDPRVSSSAPDARVPRGAPARTAAALLRAARVAYAAGRTALGIQLARRAVEACADSAAAERWRAVAWVYPPAYDSLVSAAAAPPNGVKLERELLLALIWQESKFEPAARSRSGAIGLMQLKPAVANSMARMRRELPPGEPGLLDPATNLRYGTRLLGELALGFGGQVTLALAAYNAGPASAARWRRPETVGGEALEAELFQYAETQDYVKSILAARQAYRELAPRAAAAGGPPLPAGGRPER